MTRESLVIAICALLLGVASPPAEASIGDRDDVRRRKATGGQAGRLIWDYRDSAPDLQANPPVTLASYHTWLLDYCKSEQPKRLVLYVTSPLNPGSGFCDFYDPTATSSTGATDMNLVGFLKSMATDPDTRDIEVDLFASISSFPSSQTGTCGGWTASPAVPVANGIHPPRLPATGWNATNMGTFLDWFGTLASNPAVTGGSLKGMSIDPESKTNPAGNAFYLELLIWMDMYRLTGPSAVRSMEIGITVGFASHTYGKLVTSDFPIPGGQCVSEYTPNGTCALPAGGTTYLSPSRELTYRTGTTNPIVDNLYLQVYDACGYDKQGQLEPGSFYRWICQGGADSGTTPSPLSAVAPWTSAAESSANLLAATLRRDPQQPGPGLISATANPHVPNPVAPTNPGGVDLIGHPDPNGDTTRFKLWSNFTRLQLIDGTDRIPASPASWDMMNDATSDTATQANGLQVDQPAPLPYRYTELSIDYRSPTVTSAQVDRFWFIFSAEKANNNPFFGYWTYPDFQTFLSTFESLVQDPDHAPFASAPGTPITTPLQFGIYSLFEASRHWGNAFYTDPYPESFTCIEDANHDGRVDGIDLAHVLMNWSGDATTADFDRDGIVGESDLFRILQFWGDCS